MEKNYEFFSLKHGDIADFAGEALVVPCFSDLTPAYQISESIKKKLEGYGGDAGVFAKIHEAGKGSRLKLFSAHYYNLELNWKGIILASCYVDYKDKEENMLDENYYVKTAKTTANALQIARKIKLKSIAFPVLGAGRHGGNLEAIVPAMIDEIIRHKNLKRQPKDIIVYSFEEDIFKEFKKISDFKLRAK